MPPGLVRRDRGALEVVDRELVVAGLADDVLVGGPERREVHRLGGLDRRHQQLAGAVGLLHVDREAEVDVGRGDQVRLAVDHVEADVHLRHRPQRLDQRVADEVGEGDLAAAGAGEVVVDDHPVVPQQLDRDRAHRGRGRDGQRDVHVLRGAGRGAAEHGVGRLVLGRGRRGRARSLGIGLVGALGGLGGLAWLPGRGLRRPARAVGLGLRGLPSSWLRSALAARLGFAARPSVGLGLAAAVARPSAVAGRCGAVAACAVGLKYVGPGRVHGRRVRARTAPSSPRRATRWRRSRGCVDVGLAACRLRHGLLRLFR